jgi:hypothetical protein
MKKNFLVCLLALSLQISRAQIYDTLPVIFHIIYNGEAYGAGTNLDSSQVYSQLDVLNEDYRMQNADLVNTPSVFASVIGDMGLNFAAATVDPNGVPLAEPGIHRVDRNTMGFTAPPYSMSYFNSNIKPATVWSPFKYLNVWVTSLSPGLLGYCTFPNNAGLACMGNSPADSLRDGIVIHYCALGRSGNICPPFHKGRTATYQIAQWLGLRRLAQSGCGDDCVTDTPVGDYTATGCPSFPQVSTACNNGPNGDMLCNFMSYVDDSCKVMFTQGQKGRIDTTLTWGTFQSALRISNTAAPLSIGASVAGKAAEIYPNPSEGAVTVYFGNFASAEVEVYSMVGELVYATRCAATFAKLDLGFLPKGVYQLNVRAGGNTTVLKMVRQ